MSSLPPFSSAMAYCVKCGYSDADVEWVAPKPAHVRHREPVPAQSDYLKRICNRCGYVWRESCIDAPR